MNYYNACLWLDLVAFKRKQVGRYSKSKATANQINSTIVRTIIPSDVTTTVGREK